MGTVVTQRPQNLVQTPKGKNKHPFLVYEKGRPLWSMDVSVWGKGTAKMQNYRGDLAKRWYFS